jgi:phage baseplate assembly protein W
MIDSNRIAKITQERELVREAAYSDIMTNFNKHPETGKLMRSTNANAVKRGIRNLIYTKKGERMFQPDFGCDVHSLLFDNFSPSVTQLIRTQIVEAIENFEPRVSLLDVIVTPVEARHLYSIVIAYELANDTNTQTVSLQLERVR